MKSILDKDFKYDPAHDTDVTRVWEKAKEKLEELKRERERNRDELRKKVDKIIPHIGRRQA